MELDHKAILGAIVTATGAAWGIVLKVFAEKHPELALLLLTMITAAGILGFLCGGPEDKGRSAISVLLIGLIFFCAMAAGYFLV